MADSSVGVLVMPRGPRRSFKGYDITIVVRAVKRTWRAAAKPVACAWRTAGDSEINPMNTDNPNSDADATAGLARFLAQSRWEDVPETVRHAARRTLLNCIGTALGGCREPAIEHALAVLRQFSGPAQAALIGRAERLDVLSAAFVNAAAANVFDFDDTHLQTVIHPSAPVVPAALALAERRHASGREMLHALVLGVEAECRVGNAVSPWHYAHGWHITSTCGVIGAAAAAGRLLGLDPPCMVAALGLGATQACGLLESLGTMAKSISVGNAPRNGIVAALLAERGYAAAARTLDGAYGFIHVMGERPDAGAILRGLGVEWESARVAYKPYPCGIVLHPVIDALLALRAEHALEAANVGRVKVRAHPLLAQRTDRKGPRSGCEAQVSLQHAVAVCLLHGAAGIREFTDAAAADPLALALGERVEIEDDPAMGVEAASVTVHTADARMLRRDIEHALGSLGRPMSDAELEAKLREQARSGAPGFDPDPLLDALWRVERLPDAAVLAQLLQPTPA
jgi:2-methylcitrate dehydratase PrpD